jgi:quercetin dioxygenase-like cupin family protein
MLKTLAGPAFGRKTLQNTYNYAGGLVSVLISGEDTDSQFALIEAVQKPGAEPPIHTHENEDETFYVLEGEMSVLVGDSVHRLSTGDFIFLPRGVRHTFRVKSKAARALNFMTPAGFETWFRELGTPAQNFELPENVTPPSEADLARMQALGEKLRVTPSFEPVNI